MNPLTDPASTVIAGTLLIAVPIAFNATFAALAVKFDYPNILRKPTADVLAKFSAGGSALVLLWWGFAMTAALLTPLVILVSVSLQGATPAVLLAAAAVGVVASVVQFLGLMRWPFLVPHLARESESRDATPARREAIDVVFQSLNRYLGVAVGEHLGFLFTGAWTALVGVAILQSSNVNGWVGVTGIAIGLALALCSLEFVGPFEPQGWKPAAAATPFVYIVWSLWLIVTGIALLL
ncbi:DUF4386 domain-containing protein [uncultured Microbacterium sp.]|uniref:DUF4386 domain-containing protein n=1 Tax=uncultured Microbacterium sp. TaxID=191216 RepID=A0A1Y5P6Z5_9MICO|nr:DUF4386 domain-containing protein [uncultured Microbacterium sp.]SBS71881.1 conserved membrane hypothetical protein [uncultured Microbacterium sp.]